MNHAHAHAHTHTHKARMYMLVHTGMTVSFLTEADIAFSNNTHTRVYLCS